MKYRPDIDGLRAFAVLPVLAFHAGSQIFSGGYAGVDVFFVISGFLITSIILQKLQGGQFSFVHFYERRARRILPLLLTVITATLITAIAIMTPNDLVDTSKSAIAAISFISNMYFMMQDGYFATAAELQPLLHTWSLAVEEQYYILFPIVIGLLWWVWRGGILPLLILGFIVSFILANWGGAVDLKTLRLDDNIGWIAVPDIGYYILPTRAWEILMGSIIAWIACHDRAQKAIIDAIPGVVANIITIIGLAMILVSYFIFDRTTPYPSLYTALCVFGTGIILLWNRPTTIVHRLLSNKILVGLGLISYSLYLWHYPFFAFVRILFGDVSVTHLLLLCLPIIALSWGSWRYIEGPFRNAATISAKRLWMILGIWALMLVSACLYIITQNGFINRYNDFQKQFFIAHDVRGDYVREAFNANKSVDLPNRAAGHNILLVGDSHAQDFMNIINEGHLATGKTIATFHIPVECQFIVNPEDSAIQNIPLNKRRSCDNNRDQFKSYITAQKDNIDHIIIVFSWREWSMQVLRAQLDALRPTLSPRTTVTVIGPKSFAKAHYQTYKDFTPARATALRTPLPEKTHTIDMMGKQDFEDTEYNYISMMDIICDKSSCQLFDQNGKLLSYDVGHLTKDGAIWLGQRLKGQINL